MVRADPRRGRARCPQLQLERGPTRRAALADLVLRRPAATPAAARDASEAARPEARNTAKSAGRIGAEASIARSVEAGRTAPMTWTWRIRTRGAGAVSATVPDRARRARGRARAAVRGGRRARDTAQRRPPATAARQRSVVVGPAPGRHGRRLRRASSPLSRSRSRATAPRSSAHPIPSGRPSTCTGPSTTRSTTTRPPRSAAAAHRPNRRTGGASSSRHSSLPDCVRAGRPRSERPRARHSPGGRTRPESQSHEQRASRRVDAAGGRGARRVLLPRDPARDPSRRPARV